MNESLDPRLDAFESRLRELELELAQLRKLAAAATPEEEPAALLTPVHEPVPRLEQTPPRPQPQPTPAPEIVLPRWLVERLSSARSLSAAGHPKDALEVLETSRAKALAEGEVAGLGAILQLTQTIGGATTGSLRNRADRLAYASGQNMRFLERKLGMRAADSAPAPEPTARPIPTSTQAASPAPPPSPAPSTSPAVPAARPVAAPDTTRPRAPREPLFTFPELSSADLFGARALALAGGVVTLLGIVFFFVLAVNRGWIGPVGRVGLGATASLLVFGSGFELRRRYGSVDSALAAVGVGIAGGFVTLLAAAALYDLLPDYAALLVCAGIASVGLATALAWKSQMVAGFGLIGAMLVPVAVAAQGGLSVLGTAFVAVVFAATAAVSVRLRWRELLIAGGVVSLPQIAALAAQSEYHGQAPARVVVLVAVFAALYVATGVACQLGRAREGLGQIPTSFILSGGLLAALATARLYSDVRDEGIAFAVIASAFGLTSAVLYSRRATRDLSAYLAAIGLTVGAVALADLLTGQPLVYAWTAEAALLSWLARRVRELRYQVWSVVYLALALVHVMVLDVPPTHLFSEVSRPAAGSLTAVALAVALAVFAFYARPWEEGFTDRGGLYGLIAPFFSAFENAQRVMRSAAFWLAGVLWAYAVSLGLLAAFSSFDWAHVAVAGWWSVAGLGIVVAGLRLDFAELRYGGLDWLAVTTASVLLFDALAVSEPQKFWAFLVVGAALFAAGLAYQLGHRRPQGLPMDVSAALATFGVGILAIAAAGLLDGRPLAYVWAAGAAVLALLGWRLRAVHYQALAVGLFILALLHALTLDAPPRHLLVASAHPADGVLSVVACVLAGAILALSAELGRSLPDDACARYEATSGLFEGLRRRQRLVRDAALWIVAVLCSYAGSLVTLALFSSFDWGHVAVTVIWCAVGLVALLAGLLRGSAQLRDGGVGWLGTTIAAVVLHGSVSVEATPRAWSFAVLGVAALAAGLGSQLLVRGLEALSPVASVFVLVSVGVSVSAVVTLLGDTSGAVDPEGAALLGLAAVYGALAAAVFWRPGQRDFVTLLWGIGANLAAVAAARLLDDTYLVLAWAAGSIVFALLAARVRESRFLIAAGAYAGLALVHAVALDGPPTDLFTARLHPGGGAPAVLITAAALAVLAHHLVIADERVGRGRLVTWWLAGVLGVYGLSLAILDGMQRVFAAESLQTSFQRGHTAVSAFWGLVGLALLYAGLKRWRALRIAGFAVLGVSLAKIFLYDLPSLSSVTRALSFLAVGAVLLLGGFLYQRLATATDEQSTDARIT